MLKPTEMLKKNADYSAFFILSKYVGTAVPNLALRGFPLKSPLKIRKNFPQIQHFIFGKAFEIPKDFSRKVLCVRVWGGSPN